MSDDIIRTNPERPTTDGGDPVGVPAASMVGDDVPTNRLVLQEVEPVRLVTLACTRCHRPVEFQTQRPFGIVRDSVACSACGAEYLNEAACSRVAEGVHMAARQAAHLWAQGVPDADEFVATLDVLVGAMNVERGRAAVPDPAEEDRSMTGPGTRLASDADDTTRPGGQP
jgi:hypothetical protein